MAPAKKYDNPIRLVWLFNPTVETTCCNSFRLHVYELTVRRGDGGDVTARQDDTSF